MLEELEHLQSLHLQEPPVHLVHEALQLRSDVLIRISCPSSCRQLLHNTTHEHPLFALAEQLAHLQSEQEHEPSVHLVQEALQLQMIPQRKSALHRHIVKCLHATAYEHPPFASSEQLAHLQSEQEHEPPAHLVQEALHLQNICQRQSALHRHVVKCLHATTYEHPLFALAGQLAHLQSVQEHEPSVHEVQTVLQL